MRKILLCVLLLSGALALAQGGFPPTTPAFNWATWQLADPPQAVPAGNVSLVGNPGPATYYFWVVANDAIGNAQPAGPFTLKNGPNSFSGSNYAQVSWQTALEASSYDLLMTSSAAPPTGACSCAVATGLTTSTYNVTSNSLSAYTVTSTDPNLYSIMTSNKQKAAGVSALVFSLPNGTILGTVDTNGIGTGAFAGGGGGGTPGGPGAAVQFNDPPSFGGTFAGSSNLTWNKTTNLLNIAGAGQFLSPIGGTISPLTFGINGGTDSWQQSLTTGEVQHTGSTLSSNIRLKSITSGAITNIFPDDNSAGGNIQTPSGVTVLTGNSLSQTLSGNNVHSGNNTFSGNNLHSGTNEFSGTNTFDVQNIFNGVNAFTGPQLMPVIHDGNNNDFIQTTSLANNVLGLTYVGAVTGGVPVATLAITSSTGETNGSLRINARGIGRIIFKDPLITNSLTLDANAATLPSAIAGTLIQVGNADGLVSRMEIDGFAAAALWTSARYNGTAASPTALAANDQISGISAYGYNGTALVGSQASFRTFAAQPWTPTALGTYADVAVTPNGSTTLTSVMKIENDGGVSIPSTVTGGDKGAGTLNATALYQAGVQTCDLSTVQTLTSKRITRRVVAVGGTLTTITPNTDNADVTAQGNTIASPGTLVIAADTGTPTDEQQWELRIKSASVQTFSWNAQYVGGVSNPLPTATSGGNLADYYFFIWSQSTSKWRFVRSSTGY